MDKCALRRLAKEKLCEVTTKRLASVSAHILDVFTAEIDWRDIQSVHIYRSRKHWTEVDTSLLIAWINKCAPHVSVEIAPSNNELQRECSSLFDVVFVPLLGFDDDCNRLGRGAGWYDRFLATQHGARTVGLALEICHLSSLTTEPHDMPLDMIVTERTIYRRRSPL